MRVEEGRPKRYFMPARPIPLDQLPWELEDPPHVARRLAACSRKPASAPSVPQQAPLGSPVGRLAANMDGNLEKAAQLPPAGTYNVAEVPHSGLPISKKIFIQNLSLLCEFSNKDVVYM